jgi:heparan-alpha-glucosaminide N-acetyltransferase
MFCSAIACTVWALLYLLMDVYNIRRWSIIVAPAGANPLIAYLTHPILGWSLTFIGLGWLQSYQDSHEVWANALGSAAMALAVCAVTALVAKAGLRMRI